MNIAHIAPFAPNRCGLYEAARDMARADIAGGNEVYFVDAGVTTDGIREEGKIGLIDDRAGFRLETCDSKMLDQMDLIIMHTGVADGWLVKNQIPLIWVIHGRPLACFRPESQKKEGSNAYSLYTSISKWPRSKKMLYFWPEFTKHWELVIDKNKLLALDNPVIDENRFNINGDKIKLDNPGKYNILVCDSSRDDIDLYEMTVGLIQSVRKYPGMKISFIGLEFPLTNCWNILLGSLKEIGGLGNISGRIGDMEKAYRTFDCLVSPNKIITRTIAEALSCGLSVINQNNSHNIMTDYSCDMSEPEDIIKAMDLFVNDFDNKKINKDEIIKRASCFNLENYYTKMNDVYNELVGVKND